MLLIKKATQLVRVCKNKEIRKVGEKMGEIELVENGSIAIGADGKIMACGPHDEVEAQLATMGHTDASFSQVIDATGKSIVPGFIDGHTHPVWSGDRVHEFAMKLQGATYMDIHRMGGGIGFTVRHTRESSEEELGRLLEGRLDRMLRLGTTTVECKSGYGLDMDTEVKMLKVLHDVGQRHPLEIVSTYLGAHSVPKGSTAQQYADEIVSTILPKIKELKDQGVIGPTFIDVFHEKGVFETPETEKIFQAGVAHGFAINFHGDELNDMQSASLGARFHATAISHLEKVNEEGISAMAREGVVAVLLPTTAYVLRLEQPPARAMISAGVPVALATDFNPNAHFMSMPFVMNLACVCMRMTMNEALVASTINAAAALGLSNTHGSLEEGKFGDLLIIDSPSWEHVIYESPAPVSAVVKRGKVFRP